MFSTYSYYSILALVHMHAAQGLFLKGSIMAARSQTETCEALKNEETYSSVKVLVGKPPQAFQLVADTGSDNCIVKDCICDQCLPEWGKACFKEPLDSKSFEVPTFKQDQYGMRAERAPAKMAMNFGSGEISAEIASDQVSIGSIETYMENGLLLMYDHSLEIKSHFEGILGLGRPNSEAAERPGQPEGLKIPGFLDSARVNRFSICFNHGADGVLGINTKRHHNTMTSVGKTHWGLDFHGISIGDQEFKMGSCDPRLKTAAMETACSIIPDTGTTLIVGPEAQIATLYEELCNNWPRCKNTHRDLHREMSKMAKQGIKIEGPAGALDLMEGPAAPLALLEEDFDKFTDVVSKVMARSTPEQLFDEHGGILDGGTSTHIASDPLAESEDDGEFSIPPSMTLQLLLEHCSSWIEEVDLNQEMPELNFHVADTRGHKDTLKIPPISYIFSKAIDIEVPSIRNVLGFPLKIRSPSNEKVCMMGFSAMDYSTELNGDVWIFGTPLFYEYTAFYDRGTGAAEDITLGFTPKSQSECGQCEGQKIVRQSLLDEQVKTQVGLEALNHLSKPPLIRNLPVGMKHI